MKVVYHIIKIITIDMKKFLFIHIASALVLFAGANVVLAHAAPTPDADLQLRMQERMENKEQNDDGRENAKETRMMDQRESMEERFEEMHARFEERRTDMLEHQAEMRDRMEARHEELSQRWEDRQAKLSDRRKQNIKNHIERIIQRMERAVERLGRLVNKIEDRLSHLEEEGADITALKLLLEEAHVSIDYADAVLETATVELRAAPDTDNPADAFGTARVILEDVKAALREAHAALVEVVVEIKKGQLIPNDQDDSNDEDQEQTEDSE